MVQFLKVYLFTDVGIRAGSCLALGIATIVSLLFFVVCSIKDNGVEFRGSWGGFGGSSGGWRFSRSLSFLLAAVAFGAFLAVVAISDSIMKGDPQKQNPPKAPAVSGETTPQLGDLK